MKEKTNRNNRKTKKFILAAIILIYLLPAFNINAGYNSENAINYARRYVNNYNTYYKSFKNDCTNFASQCLQAGGVKMDSAASKSIGINDESSLWYHERYTITDKVLGITYRTYTDWKVSTTWCRVSNTGSGKGLYQYLIDTKKFTVIVAQSPEEAIKYASVGDIIQCAKEGKSKSHSVIVTSKYEKDLGVTYHSNNRDNVSFISVLAPSYSKFYIIKVR